MKITQNETQTTPVAAQTGAETVAGLTENKEVDVPQTGVKPQPQVELTTKERVFERLKHDPENATVEKEIEFDGQKMAFRIKRMSYAECARLDGKKYRKGANGQIVRDVAYEETVGLQWQLREGVVRDENIGKTDPATGNPLLANWVPMFSMDEISEIMANPGAKMFIYALVAAVWEVTPELNPSLQAAALAGM